MKKKILYAVIIDKWIDSHRLKVKESTAYNYDKAIPFVKAALGHHPIRTDVYKRQSRGHAAKMLYFL